MYELTEHSLTVALSDAALDAHPNYLVMTKHAVAVMRITMLADLENWDRRRRKRELRRPESSTYHAVDRPGLFARL